MPVSWSRTPRGRWIAATLLVVSFSFASRSATSHAQEQIKPYFLLVFDTSGSMAWDANDDNVGETDPTSRMYQAKAAITDIVNSTGDAVFGLERFIQSCTPATNGCSCSGANNPCGARNGGEVLLGITEDNQPLILEWVDGDAPGNNAVCDYDRNLYELRAEGRTPLEGSLDDALVYFEDGVLNAWSQDYLGVGVSWTSPIEEDQNRVPAVDQCRPYAVILLTDGNETCGGTPGTASTALRTTTVNGEVYDVRTYVIGFGVAGPDADLEAIASAGGTDNPGDGLGANTLEAFYPQDQVDLALALSQIIQDSLLIEVCNGVDDDCDTLIDEGVTNACGTCGALVEACNAVDDDCDGQTDEGFTLYCDRPGGVLVASLCADPGERVCDLLDDNCNGIIDEGNVCNGCVPSPELCDGIDNDCDGLADDGITRPCGTDVGECTPGLETCVAGVWGACSGVGPGPELCNALDDDCNGVIDGMLEDCGSDVGECQAGRRRCDAGVYGPCVGELPPTAELCDLLDNDCDGATDEGNPGGGAACGTDVGECAAGVYACVAGELVCSGAGPLPEACDGLDNDCNGLVDDGNPGGGAPCGLVDVGECSDGVLRCLGGAIVCEGGQGPVAETCDTRDNDCDGETDEEDPALGTPCGTDEGECVAGATECVDGELVCGGVGPVPEVCDALDNDCDGAIDEGLPIGEACGTDEGECEPGVFRCTDGVPTCDGEVGPGKEICDGLDNDCDGAIDEELALGEECGDAGCELGRLQCVDGAWQCVGGVAPQEEVCDCFDNDCDDLVDENPDELCPPGARCVDCSCALPCSADLEFPCPPDRECVDGWCVNNPCAGVTCGAGEWCVGGDCVSRCVGVECPSGTRCTEGRCVADDCFHFPEDCGQAEACIGGECRPDPCEGVDCASGQYCRAGDCVATCIDVVCGAGQKCVDGRCEPDPCAGIECAGERRLCDPASGECVDDQCVGVDCPLGSVCDRLEGGCVDDPCNATRCPTGQVCELGVCDEPGRPDPTPAAPTKRVLATGGGGCMCAVPGAGGGSGGAAALFGVLVCLVLAVRRRRGLAGAAITIAVAAPLLVGCDVDPYCIECPDPGGDLPDASGDAGWITYDASPEDGGVGDGGDPDGCVPGAVELCNGADDDCDGDVDEGIDLDSPAHCGSCDNVCTLEHTFPRCDDGVCSIDHCDVGFLDLDDDPANGCEYQCTADPNAVDDSECNGRDEDCDGLVDEDVNGLTDDFNCGVDGEGHALCGVRCVPPRGVGDCVNGACVLLDCDDGYVDVNEEFGDGCEYPCTPSGDETCDGRDNDCDGEVDDGNPGGGADCGSAVGACRQGSLLCDRGRYVCDGEIAPAEERCNLVDDDCDGAVDEADPEAGAVCGTDEGECVAGRNTCNAGVLECVGAQGPSPETCDAHDNDCNGAIDEGNPGGGAPCGPDTGECVAGTERCVGGAIVCRDAVGPSVELCNGLDDDCDGQSDEDFAFGSDPDNCGGCGTQCDIVHAYAWCDAGQCAILQCESGFIDRNGNPIDGCEVACDFLGDEVCNGRDDDCDDQIDEGVAAPVGLCNPNGECAGAPTACGGAAGWQCQYGATVEQDGAGNLLPETLCDGLDNDCDGFVDEHVPLKGVVCSNGVGACLREGAFVCDGADPTGPVVCNAPPAGNPGVETCNGIDDDCDSTIDDGVVDDMVAIPGAGVWIFRYEASRPDATDLDQGADAGRACSRAGVLPWTDVTWDEASDACVAAGKRLCTAAEWQDACRAVTNDCAWSYDDTAGFACEPAPSAYNAAVCNGNEYDFDAGTAGDQDGLLPTGELAHCGSDQAAGAGLDLVTDLSGNVKEWSSTDPAGGGVEYEIRGGAYNNPAGGLQCDFDFTVGEPDFHFPNVGFRCCSSSPP